MPTRRTKTPAGTLLTGCTQGDFARVLALTEPLWKAYAARHGLTYRVAAFRYQGRPAQYAKLAAIKESLRHGPVLWVDADSFPTADAPNALDEPCPGEVLGIPIDDPCPHASMLMAGIIAATPDAAAIFDRAASLTTYARRLMPDQRALGIALGFRPRGLRFRRLEATDLAAAHVHRLGREWVTTHDTWVGPGSRVWIWHAAVPATRKLEQIATWINQKRHKIKNGEVVERMYQPWGRRDSRDASRAHQMEREPDARVAFGSGAWL